MADPITDKDDAAAQKAYADAAAAKSDSKPKAAVESPAVEAPKTAIKQPAEITIVETYRSAAIMARRPATCIGPIIEMASTAASLAMPRSSKIGRMWLIIIP